VSWAINDTVALARRNLLHYTRVPQLLVFTFIQPIMFVLLFRYVFGGTIQVPDLEYVDYLMPGIFGQVVVFGTIATALGLAEDLGSGIIERFRSLPMARTAVLAGRTSADLVRNGGVVVVMLVIGIAVGFRPHGGVPRVIAAGALVLAFSFALSWIMAFVGLKVATGEAAQAVAFPILFPLTFASAAFVPVNTMPGWLQAFAAHQPVTVVVNAVRGLMLGPDDAANLRRFGVFNTSTTGYVIQSVLWIAFILAVFVPLAVREYNKS
jgi:ABC transporter DrrB family efflux protein